MSSRLNVKQSKNKDRPRSSDKLKKGKRDGTPEKPNTPSASQEASTEEDPTLSEKKVIVNAEILAMQIKQDDLQKLREPKPPADRRKTPVTSSYVVRKIKPASEWNKPKPKTVAVAKPAPPDSQLKPIDYTSATGARFDLYGNIIPHSILGSVEEFKKQALEHGDLPPEMAQIHMADMDRPLTAKYEKKSRVSSHPKMQSVTQSNALDNWQAKMLERKKQQGYLSNLLNKQPEQLVMNQADSYRKTQEQRYLIDRTIPTVDYGKGYRVGSEFWKQQEPIGNDLTGINMSLTQSERGYPPPITHVGVPKSVLQEKGTRWDAPRTPLNKPWHKNKYLQERKEQLSPMMKELDPHIPSLENLEIIGKKHSSPESESDGSGGTARREVMEIRETYESLTFPPGAVVPGSTSPNGRGSRAQNDKENEENVDPLSGHPDVHPAPIFGPSILFSGQPARWTGDSHAFRDQVGIEARVTFEEYAARRVTSYLEIVNDGTTAMYYDWKKIPKTNPFDIVNAKVQRFYFNNSSGVILPGDTMKFPIVFKSPNAGVFTDQWKFETHPVVCGGAALIVTLRGVALQEDKYKYQRSKIEEELNTRQAEQIVYGILQEILDGIRSPDRPASPVDAYITDEEIFSRKNPGLHYDNEIMIKLREIYTVLFPEEEQESQVWDLDVQTIKEKLLEMDADDERKQEFLQKVNQAVISMSFPPFTPKQKDMYSVGYDLFCDLADNIVSSSEAIRQVLGIPDRAMDEGREEPSRSNTSTPSTLRSGKGSASSTGRQLTVPVPGERERSGSFASRRQSVLDRMSSRELKAPISCDGKRQAGGGKGKADSKDKKAGPRGGPGSPIKAGASKESSKSGGKITPGPGKRPPTTTRSDKDAGQRPSSGEQVLPPGVDPILDQKYRDKLYTQSRDLVSNTLDKMDNMFQGIQEASGEGPRLPQLT